MGKRKSKGLKVWGITSAAAVAGLAAGNPVQAEAGITANQHVEKAEKLAGALKWEVSYEHRKAANPKHAADYPDMKLFNETKAALREAEKAVKEVKGKDKELLEARLNQHVRVYFDRAVKYIDAVSAGKKITAKAEALEHYLVNHQVDDAAEKAYHDLSLEIKRRSPFIYKAYGKTTRDSLLDTYQQKAYDIKESALYPTSLKMEMDRLDSALKNKDVDQVIYRTGRIDKLFKDGTKLDLLDKESKLYTKLKTNYESYQKQIQAFVSIIESHSTNADQPTTAGGDSKELKTYKESIVLVAGKGQYIKLANAVVNGNIIIKGNETGAGTVYLENVEVNKGGSIIVDDVAEHSLYQNGVTAEKLVINDANGANIVGDKGTKIEFVTVSEAAGVSGNIHIESKNKDAFANISIEAAGTKGSEGVSLKGDFSETLVSVSGKDAKLNVNKDTKIKSVDVKSSMKLSAEAGAQVQSINLAAEEKGQTIELGGDLKNTVVNIMNANAEITVKEDTHIKEVKKDSSVTGNVAITNNGKVEKATGVELTNNPPVQTQPPEVPGTPSNPPPSNGGGNDTEEPVPAVIESISTITKTVTINEQYSLPSEVTAKLSDGSTSSVAVTWERTSLDTSAAGEHEFFGTVEGYDKQVVLVVKVLPAGLILKDNGQTAAVSTSAAFSYAAEQPGITKIEIVDGFNAANIGKVRQEIVIPENIQDETIDFNGMNLPKVSVYGDKILIKNATIHTLNIAETVYDLTLQDVKDGENSTHNFDGGGENSIVLTGNTTFKGSIKITSGEAIQVRAEGTESKIDGTIWIESGAATKIAAPVSNVVINTENDKVIINSHIDQLILRSNANIELGEGASITNAKLRVGVTPPANISNYDVILDTFELERYILNAENLIENTTLGEKEGNVSADAAFALQTALDSAVMVKAEDREVDVENQRLIDEESAKLKEAISQFRKSVITLDLTDLHYEWQRAQRLANRVETGTEPGQYPQEEYDKLEALIAGAKAMYEGFGHSQQEVDAKVSEIQNFIEDFLKTRIEDGNDEDPSMGTGISFVIQGEQFTPDWVDVEVTPITENGGSHMETRPTINTEQVESGLKINVTELDETVAETFYIVIQTNNYLFIEEVTRTELREGLTKQIAPTGNHVPLKVNIPNVDASHEDSLSMNLTKESEKGILTVRVSPGTYIPYGTYNIHFNGERDNESYSLFKDGFTVSETNHTIQFTENDMAKIIFEMETANPLNYRLEHAGPLYSLGNKYNTILHPKFENNVNTLYLTKEKYQSINPVYSLEKNQQAWEITFRTGEMSVTEDTTIKVDDNISIKADWHPHITNHVLDVNTELMNYFNNSIVNSQGQRIENFTKLIPENEGYIRRDPVKGKVTLRVSGKFFTKEINRLDFNMVKLSDLIGGEEVSGQAELEFSVVDSPIPIESWKQTFTIGNLEDNGSVTPSEPTDAEKVAEAKEIIQNLELGWNTDINTTIAAINTSIEGLNLNEDVTAIASEGTEDQTGRVVITISSGEITDESIVLEAPQESQTIDGVSAILNLGETFTVKDGIVTLS
ncbi:Ig-like domain-containing protein [Bacillus sp. NTK034]|uniref:Ig-like domain-containing protein n=1 Tax=Bacillus sp. NTK034 TaxID=2802176 RepID=UPI001A8D1B2F|nr:Ig-like domain-containing protein [Bacillus sp. NTK034]MBN8201459.1 Ig-like domain-containing protein [Bacillus sp. NTK034]